MAKTSCPIFKPTMDEFKDFRKYLDKLASASSIGLCKIIPPDGWFVRTYDIDQIKLLIPAPIQQVVMGRAGVFDLNLIEIHEMSLKDFENYDQHNRLDQTDFDLRERSFWRSLGCPSQWDDPIYGADVMGSLFEDDKACGWNVNDLDSMLRLLGSDIPGVNCSYLYVGTWRSMFAFHTEDLDLYSINYLHTGAAKSWYSVAPQSRRLFESMAASFFPEEHLHCREFLRHKTKLFSPSKMREFGISFTTAVQMPGEFIVTFPGSYHAGFNHGFNIAEATNFATPSWLSIGRKAKRCICRPGSVQIDLDHLETLYGREQVLKAQRNASKDPFRPKGGHLHGFNQIRCKCGARGTMKTEGLTQTMSAPDKPLSQCSSCGMWFHELCTANFLKSFDDLPPSCGVDSSCHACFLIEASKRLKDQPVTLAPPIAPFIASGGGDAELEVKQEIKVENSSQMLGATVLTWIPGCLHQVEGVITDIEDELGRVHIKGTRKNSDQWVHLETCVIVELQSQTRHIAASANPASIAASAHAPSVLPLLSSSTSLSAVDTLDNINLPTPGKRKDRSFGSEVDSRQADVAEEVQPGQGERAVDVFERHRDRLAAALSATRIGDVRAIVHVNPDFWPCILRCMHTLDELVETQIPEDQLKAFSNKMSIAIQSSGIIEVQEFLSDLLLSASEDLSQRGDLKSHKYVIQRFLSLCLSLHPQLSSHFQLHQVNL